MGAYRDKTHTTCIGLLKKTKKKQSNCDVLYNCITSSIKGLIKKINKKYRSGIWPSDPRPDIRNTLKIHARHFLVIFVVWVCMFTLLLLHQWTFVIILIWYFLRQIPAYLFHNPACGRTISSGSPFKEL